MKIYQMPIKLYLVASSILLADFSTQLRGSETSQFENNPQWYVLQIDSAPMGYVFEKIEKKAASGTVITSNETKLEMPRLGSRLKMTSQVLYSEKENGDLHAAEFTTTMSSKVFRVKLSVDRNKAFLSTGHGDRLHKREIQLKGKVLGPHAIKMLSLSKLKKVGDSIHYQTFLAELTSIGKVTRTLKGRETLNLNSQKIPTIKIAEKIEGLPPSTLWLDKDGLLVKQEALSPFGNMEIFMSNQNAALQALKNETLPADFWNKSVAISNIRLPIKQIDRLVLEITKRNPHTTWPEFETDPRQTILKKTENTLLLEVKRIPSKEKGSFPLTLTEEQKQYLKPNAFLQSNDSNVRRIAQKVITDEKNVYSAARKLKQWVHRNMRFDTGVILAPASEIIENRKGTCSEYAILLTSLFRSVGIPSRVAIGWVYVAGMWGGHAWTEVLIDDQWIALDATEPSPLETDATRLSMATFTMEEGMKNLARLQSSYGQCQIHVRSFTVDGIDYKIPPQSTSYEVKDRSYKNPWLGLTLTVPEGFTYKNLDAVWPSYTIAEADGPGETNINYAFLPLFIFKVLSGGVDSMEKACESFIKNLGIKDMPKRDSRATHVSLIATSENAGAIITYDSTSVLLVTVRGTKATKYLQEIKEGISFENISNN